MLLFYDVYYFSFKLNFSCWQKPGQSGPNPCRNKSFSENFQPLHSGQLLVEHTLCKWSISEQGHGTLSLVKATFYKARFLRKYIFYRKLFFNLSVVWFLNVGMLIPPELTENCFFTKNRPFFQIFPENSIWLSTDRETSKKKFPFAKKCWRWIQGLG